MRRTIKRTTAEVLPSSIPDEVLQASAIDWEVMVDAYLFGAAFVGGCYAARAFLDRSGAIDDGMTVLTPVVGVMVERSGFVLVRSLSGQDHYVIVSRHEPVRE
ncbi:MULTISPECIES: hypothetical protein [unclassified Pseudomonas]|jgi:hypothetical protein|uniref:hypothetical protein n=1 Tax=unclassified Pseudomonas TaxID=196821 RepID=UPI0006768D02|nr:MULTISPECIES: hypothetical protein [unclassified Pseudomonas]KNC14560.1 hypothetical protein AC788_11405 [Pseudomonas sp. RIT-PI-a]